MKNTILLSLLLAMPALAGTTQVINEPPPPTVTNDSWQWFIGGSAGYLLDYEEDMYTLRIGANSPWVFSGWSVSLFAEGGWTENHDALDAVTPPGGDNEIDLVPITLNARFEHLISGGLSAYVGGGLGASYVDAEVSGFGATAEADDWVFTAQVFAGLAYHVNDNVEIFGGARWIYFDDPSFSGVSLDDDVLFEGGLTFHF
ncbi:porin family protein [Luteolibacter yonseiensis]|uniref:Porin family protein n=1 Tax=Luteolibacter yonseiensis TaxID=1144680 RepID=A0A934R290_9BACT|nr:P44/Msp2 family outer membrane protein [Luteolibacter yonseiensis]MBK1815117.1 porin family protein [Luteolibacter yonseiensis]